MTNTGGESGQPAAERSANDGARVITPTLTKEYYFKEGCHILELSNDDHDAALSIARARVEPKMHTRKHALVGVTERYVIQQGQGEVFLGEQPPIAVSAGAVVIIPAGVSQSIRNTGEGDLVFLALCTPRFTPCCYRDLESDSDKIAKQTQ